MWLTRSHQILLRILRPVSFGSMIISGVAVLLMICFIVLDVIIRGVLSGRMKKHRIKVIKGDRVQVSVSPYDTTHGIITYRFK